MVNSLEFFKEYLLLNTYDENMFNSDGNINLFQKYEKKQRNPCSF